MKNKTSSFDENNVSFPSLQTAWEAIAAAARPELEALRKERPTHNLRVQEMRDMLFEGLLNLINTPTQGDSALKSAFSAAKALSLMDRGQHPARKGITYKYAGFGVTTILNCVVKNGTKEQVMQATKIFLEHTHAVGATLSKKNNPLH